MMMLKRQEKAALEFIAGRFRVSGVCPSYDEIGVHLGLKSKANVWRAISGLVDKGFLTRRDGCARSLGLTNAASAFLRNDLHPASCSCAPCAAKRLEQGHRLIQALRRKAPPVLHAVTLVGIKLTHPNFSAAAHAAGVSLPRKPSGMSAAREGSHSKVRP